MDWLHQFTCWYAAWSVVWCTSALLHFVSSGSIADVVPFKQAGGSIVPTAETALSPARPLRMWDWTYVTVKKKKSNNLHGARPLSPIDQREQSSTSSHPPAFPGASLIRSHSGVQIWDGGPLLDLSSDCSLGDALKRLNTLSLLQHVSLSPYQWKIQHLGVIAWGHWSRSDPSTDRDPEKGVRDEDGR